MISRTGYSVISVATPAPTVRPPSRIANRSSFSIATGVINSIAIVTLSPGLTISTPPGHLTPPVTSLVPRHNCGRYPLKHGVCRPPPPLPDRKPQLLLHRHRRDQLDRHRHVVPRHHHLHPRRQRHHPRHVRRPEVELRPIPVEERRVPPPPLLRPHVHLPPELPVRRDRLGLRPPHPPLHALLLPPPPPAPALTANLAPGNSYFANSSRTSSSTRSNSSLSSTLSALFRNTTM